MSAFVAWQSERLVTRCEPNDPQVSTPWLYEVRKEITLSIFRMDTNDRLYINDYMGTMDLLPTWMELA